MADMRMPPMRPTLTRTAAVWYDLRVERTADQIARRVMLPDDGTIHDFLKWQLETDTLPIRGTGSGGPGMWCGAFRSEDAPLVDAWLASSGLTAERPRT